MSNKNLVIIALIAAIAGVFLLTRPATDSELGEPRDAIQLQSELIPEQGQRSVVLVTIDTTRPDRIGAYGATNVQTDTLDNLARRGVLFENASAVSPITLVSHTSIMTARYPFEHGVRNNGIHHVELSADTLAERFKSAGYHTAAFVSAAVLDRRYGLDQGFDVYSDDFSERRNRSPRMVADRPADVTVDEAVQWLNNVPVGENYFLWVHLYDPHASYSPPAPYRDDYRERLYDGEVAFMDAEIGRLLGHGKILGAGDQAPVVSVIADHGESLGEHGERTHAILAYDSTLHIPWILYVPGGPAGLRVSESVGQVDLMPTLLKVAGVDWQPEPGQVARDLVSVIQGVRQRQPRPYYSETYLPYYTYGWAKLKVLRQGRWKWIDAPVPELFDLQRDPRELTNLAEEEPGLAHDMGRDLGEWLDDFEADQESTLSLDESELARLRSLGYLSVGTRKNDQGADRPNPMEMIFYHVGLERARSFLADRLFDQAASQLEKVLRSDPNNLSALIDLVRAREGQGQLEDAAKFAERALELDPDYVQSYGALARIEMQRDRPDRALELMDLAIGLDPSSPDTRILKANFLSRMGRTAEAGRELKVALDANPEDPRTQVMYAQVVEMRSGQLSSAETRLRAALATDPYLETGWLMLGRVMERTRRLEDAERNYRQGLSIRPDDPELHGALGHLLARTGRPDEAMIRLREAIRLSPETRTELHLSLGAVLADNNRLQEARQQYERVLSLDPDHAGARNNAAVALYRMGDLSGARKALAALVEDFPKHPDAHNNLAAIAVDTQNWQAAVMHSQQTLALNDQLPEAWNNLGVGLAETQRINEAMDAYRQAVLLDTEYWPGYFNLAELQRKTQSPSDAEQNYQQVLLRSPNHAETHLGLGFLYAESLEDAAKARVHFNAFLKYAPNHPQAAEVRGAMASL